MTISKIKPHERRKARRYIVQDLYQWAMTDADPALIEQQFIENYDTNGVDIPYFQQLLRAIPPNVVAIDEACMKYSDRRMDEIGRIELAILRLGAYELQHCLDIPYRVAINESLELAKTFASEESHKYINSILDRLARHCRAFERNKSSS